MEFLTDDPVAQAVTYQRVTSDARAPRCCRYGCRDHISVYEVTAALAG